MKRLAALSILTLAACPQDDAVVADTSTSTGPEATSDGPDLPSDESTSSTGDGDPGTTTLGDGDGDPGTTGPGDGDGDQTGDGDGEPSEAVPYSLEVESDGNRIGYLILPNEYGFYIWDDVNEVTFHVNQITGHVVGSVDFGYYPTNDCSGPRYQTSTTPIASCDIAGLPVRRGVTGVGALAGGGHVPSISLVTSTGEPQIVDVQSYRLDADCFPLVQQICAYEIVPTNAIPVTVVESTLAP